MKCIETYVFFNSNNKKGIFDLTTSGLSKNCNSMDRFLDEVELTPLYNVYVVNSVLLLYSKIENNVFTFQKCVESKKNTCKRKACNFT